MMAEKKVIAVVGATGAQGGGLVSAILEDANGPFAVRALTRDPGSERARALAARGADVVAVDIDDENSVLEAFSGAYGAFCVTFFWDHFSPERELAQAGNLARAAKGAQLQHVIWSTLEDTRRWIPLDDQRMPTLGGKYKVPHFDAKGEANQLFVDAGVPVTFLETSFYWDNFVSFGMGPKRDAEGRLAFTMPMDDKKLPGIAAEDIGRSAYGIFRLGASAIGKRFGIAGEHLSGSEMAAAFTKALGVEVRYNSVSPDLYRSFGFPGADDLGNMFQFKRDFNEEFCGVRDVDATRQLNPSLQSFDEWLARNADKIPL